MNIAFYIDEMNFRGIANQTYQLALNNKKILKNKSIIFYNKKNYRNTKEVIRKFKNKFITKSINNFKEIEKYKKKYNLDFLYTQKSGNKDEWESKIIKTLVHAVYPQKLNQIHGYRYAYISQWLSKSFSNGKIPVVPYMVEMSKTNQTLRKSLKIQKKQIVFGCHGGESSFDLKFSHDAIKKIVKTRKDITFLFLNINKFYNHPRIKFLKGTTNDLYKKKFINTCDAMIYGRSLGESFGLACAEFSVNGKPIFSYKFNRHRNHKFSSNKKQFFEYDSYKSLFLLLTQFKKENFGVLKNKYKKYNRISVMKSFQKNFLNNKNNAKITFFDIILNFFGFLKMSYFYLRHKIYNHYYNFLESKIFNIND